MSDISDLKQRVQAVGDRFGRLADQDRNYSTRLTSLLAAVEEGISRTQEQNKQLAGELAKSKEEAARLAGELARTKGESGDLASRLAGAEDENAQLRSMVQTLLAAVEEGGDAVLSQAMQDLESRIDRIVSTDPANRPALPEAPLESGAAPEAIAAEEPVETTEATEAAVAAVAAETAETPEPVGAPDIGDRIGPEEAAEDDQPASAAAEAAGAEAPLELTADMEVPEDADPSGTPEDAAAAELADEGQGADDADDEAEPEEPAEPVAAEAAEAAAGDPESTEIPEDTSLAPSGAPSDDDLTAVNKIIQRISLLTGEFVDPDQPPGAEGGNGAKKESAAENGAKTKGDRAPGTRPSDSS